MSLYESIYIVCDLPLMSLEVLLSLAHLLIESTFHFLSSSYMSLSHNLGDFIRKTLHIIAPITFKIEFFL